jgi:hypothetical protein
MNEESQTEVTQSLESMSAVERAYILHSWDYSYLVQPLEAETLYHKAERYVMVMQAIKEHSALMKKLRQLSKSLKDTVIDQMFIDEIDSVEVGDSIICLQSGVNTVNVLPAKDFAHIMK